MFKSRLVRSLNLCQFALLVFLSMPAEGYAQAKFGKISDEEWRLGPPGDFPEANAIVILDEGFIDVRLNDLTIDRLVRIKVLTKAGVEEVGELVIRYHEDDKLRNFKAHTVKPGNQKIKLEKDAIFERTANNYQETVLSFPQVSEGCILEYSYRIVTSDYHNLESWFFQGRLYTMKSTVAVRLELGFDYSASFFNVEPRLRQAQKKEEINIDFPNDPTKKLVSYTWTLTNLPPIKNEPFMGAYNDYRSSVKFQLVSWQNKHNFRTFVSTWDKLGDELIDRFELYLHKKDEISKIAHDITSGFVNRRAQSRALYDYVKSQFSNSYDYTSWYFVHDHVDKLLQTRSGSPEGKNLLLMQMHQALGIKAFPLLISTRDNGRLYTDNPDRRQFNHVLVYLEFGDGWEILDATNKNNPYGVLPPDCLVEAAFLIDKGKSELIRIPDRPRPSARTDEVFMTVDSDGKASCSTVCRFTGYYASDYSEKYEEKSPEDFVKDRFVKGLNVSYTLGSYNCSLDSTGQFTATIDFDSDELAEKLDNNLSVKPVCYCFRENPFKSEKRSFPVDFQYPFTYINVVTISLPGNAKDYQLPPDRVSNITGASFERRTTVKDTCVTITSTLKVDQPLFKPGEYKKLREFFADVAIATEDELVAVLSGQ